MNRSLEVSVSTVLELDGYQPSVRVNQAFSDLVGSIIAMKMAPHNESDERRDALRRVCSLAEGEMESYWARQIADSRHPQKTLESFPYIDNYRELVARELQCVEVTGLDIATIDTALVIGSGPLPLTALGLYEQGIHVDHIDSSPDAIQLCQGVMRALGASGDCIVGNGEEATLAKDYDLVLIAALAGENQAQKQAILTNVLPHLVSETGRIIVRSAKGARELLYPVLDPHGFGGVQLMHEYHPDDYVINSVLVYGANQ